VLQHRAEQNKLTFYRTVETVSKGANLTIHCIHDQLQKFRIKHRCFPEEFYVQLDGGSENANQYVLAYLELLVVKRQCRVVYYTRLPAGIYILSIVNIFVI